MALREFNEKHAALSSADRKSLYNSFKIPKRSGGLQPIDAPKEELMGALRQLRFIFEIKFFALYHTSAFAYIRGRCTIDAIKKHQQMESRWFAKLDFSNFFGTTTQEFVLSQLAMIFPFSEVMKHEEGKTQLTQAISLCFLDGKLPQGTPISPMLTNLMMIPIDHKISNTLRNFNKQQYVYTRYADDMTVSSKYDFEKNDITDFVMQVLREYSSPHKLNPEKTRYGSSAGSNWNLGVMLNKDNQITVGHRRLKQYKAMIHNFCRDHLNGVQWEKSDVQELNGLTSYYKMVEKAYIEHILDAYSTKFNINVRGVIKEKLRGNARQDF